MKLITIFILLFLPELVIANNDCDKNNKKISVIYLNGVKNDRPTATTSLGQIEKIFNKNKNDKFITDEGIKSVCFTYAYNQSKGIFGYQDFIEVLGQKITEEIGEEKFSWELMSKYIFQRNKFIDKLTELTPVGALTRDILEMIIDYEAERAQKAQLTSLDEIFDGVASELDKRRVILVSHSQGNLFANELYDKLSISFTSKQLKKYANLQVGSAASVIRAADGASFGDYYTAIQDNVIDKLSILGFDTLEANVDLYDYFTTNIFQWHNFIDIYTSNQVSGVLDNNGQIKTMEDIFLEKMSYLGRKIGLTRLDGNKEMVVSFPHFYSIAPVNTSVFDEKTNRYYLITPTESNGRHLIGVNVKNKTVEDYIDIEDQLQGIKINSEGNIVGIEQGEDHKWLFSIYGEQKESVHIPELESFSSRGTAIDTKINNVFNEYVVINHIYDPILEQNSSQLIIIDALTGKYLGSKHFDNFGMYNLGFSSAGDLVGFGGEGPIDSFYKIRPSADEVNILNTFNLQYYNANANIDPYHDRFYQTILSLNSDEYNIMVLDATTGDSLYKVGLNDDRQYGFEFSEDGSFYAYSTNYELDQQGIVKFTRFGDNVEPSYKVSD